jgi:tryptophanyl-tRNA synthetase
MNKHNKFNETVKALKDSKIPHDLIKHPPIHTVEEGLAFLGITPDLGVSTLFFHTDSGYGVLLRRDDNQISFEKVKRYYKATKMRFCTPDEVLNLSGCKIGFVSPFNPGFKMIMDRSILEKEYVYLGTGSPEYDLKIAPVDLAKFTNSVFVDIKEEGSARTKSRILSGITPSGDGTLHIGNYIGMVQQSIQFAKAYDCYLMVADLHALTTVQNKGDLERNVQNLILNELALLGDLKNITFFRQSDVPMHAELTWILNNVTPLGLLKRAHAYKDKLQKDVMEDEINLGLFNYPILMAADILLYKPDYVPVGKDQKQHIEITRDIAGNFNKTYKKKVFPLPEPYIPSEVAVVMGTDGKRKMSKSLRNIISIFEDEIVIKKQVMSTYTDPTRIHATDPGHIEGNMIFSYLDFFGEKSRVEEMKKLYIKGKIPDVEVKNYLYEALLGFFAPARARFTEFKANPEKVKKILKSGAEKAREVASKTMEEIRETIGLTNQYSFFRY